MIKFNIYLSVVYVYIQGAHKDLTNNFIIPFNIFKFIFKYTYYCF